MSTLRLYQYAAAALLAINITLIAFFFFTMPTPMHPPGDRPLKADQLLQLDQPQHQAFKALADQHIKFMEEIDVQHQELLEAYFSHLATTDSSNPDEQLLRQIQAVEREKIEQTYQHLADVKALLRPDQQINFQKFHSQIINRLAPKGKNFPPPPKDF